MERDPLDERLHQGIRGIVLFILVFSPLAMGAVENQHFLLVQALTAVALVFWLIRLWIKPGTRLLLPPTFWAIAAFSTYAVLRYFRADVEFTARLEITRILVYAALFILIVNNLHRQEDLKLVAYTLVGTAFLVSAYAICQFLTESNLVWTLPKPEVYRGRGSGPFISPNHLAGYLEMILPISVSLAVLGRQSHVIKICMGYAALVILAGIGVSISRGGWLTTAIATSILLVFLLRRRSQRIALGVLLLAIAIAGYWWIKDNLAVQKRLSTTFLAGGSLDDMRFRIWKPAWNMWQDHFWTGVGPGHFDHRFPQYRPENFQMRPIYAHNDYLNLGADYGMIGVILMLAILACTAYGIFKSWRYITRSANDLGTRTGRKTPLFLGSSVGLLAIAVHSVVDFNLQIPSNAILAITLLAIVTSHWRFATNTWWIKGRISTLLPLSIAGLAIAAGLAVTAAAQTREEIALHRAFESGRSGSSQRQAMLKAFAANPNNFHTSTAIGEFYRRLSWKGTRNYREYAEKAIPWFEQSLAANPFHYYACLRLGMSLDWIDRHKEAGQWFEKAHKLDPNGLFTAAHIGWHYLQINELDTAIHHFERARHLARAFHIEFPLADQYLRIIRRRLAESGISS